MADRKPTRTRRWYLPGAVGLTLLFLLLVTNATHASPGSFAAQTHVSGSMADGNPITANAPASANPGNSPNGFVPDAFAHWVYSGTTPSVITVPVGTRLSMDLFINAGSSISAAAQQSYMTFDNAVLQLVDPAVPGCVPTATILPDTTAFEAVLQNEQCNGPAPCIFRGDVVPPGTFAFASGVLSSPGTGGDFRVATATWCASNGGATTVRWQFFPPDPVTRHSEIVDDRNNEVSDRAFYSAFTVFVVGPTATATATNTPTSTPTSLPLLPPTFTCRTRAGPTWFTYRWVPSAIGAWTSTVLSLNTTALITAALDPARPAASSQEIRLRMVGWATSGFARAQAASATALALASNGPGHRPPRLPPRLPSLQRPSLPLLLPSRSHAHLLTLLRQLPHHLIPVHPLIRSQLYPPPPAHLPHPQTRERLRPPTRLPERIRPALPAPVSIVGQVWTELARTACPRPHSTIHLGSIQGVTKGLGTPADIRFTSRWRPTPADRGRS